MTIDELTGGSDIPIQVTPTALEQIRHYKRSLTGMADTPFRVEVVSAANRDYKFFLDRRKWPGDELYFVGDTEPIPLVIDRESARHLLGKTLDFHEGIGRFLIRNGAVFSVGVAVDNIGPPVFLTDEARKRARERSEYLANKFRMKQDLRNPYTNLRIGVRPNEHAILGGPGHEILAESGSGEPDPEMRFSVRFDRPRRDDIVFYDGGVTMVIHPDVVPYVMGKTVHFVSDRATAVGGMFVVK